jgi:F0F1-type ATP synthase membrane subunit b/b'
MWHDPYLYMVLSFIVFLWFIGRPLYQKFLIQLRERSSKIEQHIEEVESLYREAQDILLEQKNALVASEKSISVLETETQERVKKIREEQEHALNVLEETAQREIKKEVESLKEDFKHSIQAELMDKSYRNVQWIITHKLTDEQRKRLISEAIERI